MEIEEVTLNIIGWLIRIGRGVRIDPLSMQPEESRILTSITADEDGDSIIKELAVNSAHQASPDCMFGHSEDREDHSASCKTLAHRFEASFREMGVAARVRNLSKIKVILDRPRSSREILSGHFPVDRIDIIDHKGWDINSYIVADPRNVNTIKIIDCKAWELWVPAYGFYHCPNDLVKQRNIA